MKAKHKEKYEHGNIAKFNCTEFVIWMKMQNFSFHECQIFQGKLCSLMLFVMTHFIIESQIDGEIFMKLSESDIKSLIENKETVVKLMELQNQKMVPLQ